MTMSGPSRRDRRAGLALGLAALCAAAACSPADLKSDFTLTYQAPAGSGAGAGEVEIESFLPFVDRDFRLPAAVPVTGTLTDGTGAPLAGAAVEFVSRRTGVLLGNATTDGAGGYTVDLAPGTYDVHLASGAASTGDLAMPQVAVPGGGPVVMDFQFPATLAVDGAVLEELGASIPGATLQFTGRNTGAVVDVVADGLGDFAADLPPDVYDVVVTPVGGAAATQLAERFTTAVTADGTLDFQLTEGVMVSGTVLDDLGAALLEDSSIEVVLPVGSSFLPPPDALVDALDGSYSIGPVPPGLLDLRIEPPGDTGFPVQDVPLSVLAGGPLAADLPLLAGFVLTGTILQEGGVSPEELVDVLPIPLDGSLPPLNAVTDAAGNYAVSLFPGQYDVQFLPEVTNLQLPELHTLNITGDTAYDLNLTTGALLTGVVTAPGGVFPAEDVLVSIPGVLGAESVTDAAGNYSLLAPLGTHVIELEALDGTYKDFSLAGLTGVDVFGPTNLDIEMIFSLIGSTVVRGTVYEADGTTPAAGVLVTATDNATGAVLGKALTDGSGDYTLVVP